jgi:hypothetical protein
MKRLNKQKLDFETSLKYVQDNLDKTNALSSELLNLINFKTGNFFTLLPDDANIQEIHNFKAGWILPPNPIEEYYVGDFKATYSIKNSIEDELIPLIFKLIESKTHFSCIMDDFEGYPKERYPIHFIDNYSLFYGDEIYFRLAKDNLSTELIVKCLRASNVLWHSLCIFTTANLIEVSKMLNLEKIKEICKRTELFMVCAYDGEGYVFWEKHQSNTSIGLFEE